VLVVELAPAALVVDGAALPAPAIEAGRVTGLEQALVSRVRQGPTGKWRLTVHPDTPCELLRATIATAERVKIGRPLVALPGGAPILLGMLDGKRAQAGLALTLFVSPERLVAYSLSELEGTLRRPAAEVPGLDGAQMVTRLAEIKTRHPAERELIVICAEPSLTAGQLLPVLVAVQPVFPELALSGGIM
jgi:hypothetical protein